MTQNTIIPKFCGIDYSLNSPSIAIIDGDTYRLYFLSLVQKAVKTEADYLFGTHYPKFYTFEERIDKISDWAINIIEKEKPKHIGLEDYSFNSVSSSTMQIAENTGLLKHKIYQRSFPLTLYAPKVIKKFATKNGNAGKFLMEQHFIKQTGKDLRKDLNGVTGENPTSDIIDAYFISQLVKKDNG